MNTGDSVICKKETQFYTKYSSYKILNIVYVPDVISGTNFPVIFNYELDSDSVFNTYFSTTEFEEYFYSSKELRKEKLKNLFHK